MVITQIPCVTFFSNELGITISQESEEDMDFDDLLDKLFQLYFLDYWDGRILFFLKPPSLTSK